MKYPLYGCDGKPASGRLMYPVGDLPRHIDSEMGCVVTEGEPVGVCGLPVIQARVLFRVPIEELDPEPGVVDEEDPGCRHPGIGTEKDLPYLPVSASEFGDHHLDFPSEGFPLDNRAEKDRLLSIELDRLPDEHVITEIMYVDGSVKFLGTPGATQPRTGVEILQHRVITQPADDIESKSDGSRDEVMTREQAVPYKDVRDAEQLLPVFRYRPETLRCLVVAVLLHMLKIERSAASRGERKRLHREKEPRVADSGADLCETEDLKATFHRTRASRPVPVEARGLRAGFAQEAMVKGDRTSMSVTFKEHAAVEGAPVELTFEVLPEAALVGVSVPGHRQEIHPSVYCQYQNHCLDEETFKIFSYFCIPVECGNNNRTYLVKWLELIHHSLICTYKVTKNSSLDQIFQAFILLKFKEIYMFFNIIFPS